MTPQSKQSSRSMEHREQFSHRWAVILAGGDGKRLLPLIRQMYSEDRPKQFCRILNGETLLHQTRRRVEPIIEARRTVVVVNKEHERFYAGHFSEADRSLLVQPCNRGTTPAILCSLIHVYESDPTAVIGFFPSDHHIANDESFTRHLKLAFDAAESNSDLVLLGVVPDNPEVEYGWIEPGAAPTPQSRFPVFQVSQFWEKPSFSLACALMERGCLWNSFIMVGRVGSFLRLIRRALPELFSAFTSSLALPPERQDAALSDLYARMDSSNFSTDVLAVRPNDLLVLPALGLGWSDLGDAHRVLSLLGRKDVTKEDRHVFIEKSNAAG